MKKSRFISIAFAVLLLSIACAIGACASKEPKMQFENLIRFEEPTGPRFSATLPREIYDDEKLTEYGFIVMSYDKYKAAGLSTLNLDTDADFLRGINYGTVGGKKIDKHLALDDSYVTFSCVITNITEEHFRKGIVARAYAIYDGNVYYSYRFETSYLGNAKDIKNSEEYDTLDAEGKELIDYIITCCAEEEDGNDEEIMQPEEPSPEEIGGYRLVSNYDIALDDEYNWRHYYELYNPYTGRKEYDVPGVECAKKAKQLGDAVEAGTLIMFDGEYVDGSTAEEYSYSWLGTSGSYDTHTIVPYTADITCPDCLSDYFEDNKDTSLVINAEVPVSVLSYSSFDNAFEWGSIRLSSSEEMLELEKSVQCYNEKALDENENYFTKYFKFPKFIYKSTGEYEDGAEVCDFILIVANGDEECALGEMCEMHENIEEVQNCRIVSNYDLVMTDDGNRTIEYEVYNPFTCAKEYAVQSVVTESKASNLQALEAGTLIKLKNGYVDETDPDTILGAVSEENLVWIRNADEDGVMTLVPYDKNVSCRTCAEEYIEGYEGGAYKDISGNEHTSGILKLSEQTPISTLTYGAYNESFFKWSTMSLTNYSHVSNVEKELLCYNEESLDKNENYITTYSDYVKAYVCATDDDNAYFVIVIVNGDEGAAYNVECEKHTGAALSEETAEQAESYSPEHSGPALAGVVHTADEM